MWKMICVAGVLFAALNTQAIEFIQTEQFVTETNGVLLEETWISAENVTIAGEALDDLFTVSTLLDLRGVFMGDVWGGGDSVSADGIFNDNLRLIGRTVQVSGTLNGSLVAMGNTVKIDPTATIEKSMICIGESVVTEGTIRGDVRIIAQNVTLNGEIAGDVSIAAQKLTVLPGTVIGGNLTYTAPKELILSQSVTLGGELTRTFEAAPEKQLFKPNLIGHFMFGLAALVTGLVFIGLFPRYSSGSFHALNKSRGISMLIGFAALFMLPITAFILLFTFVGTPLSILLFLFYLILLYLSKIIVALAIGSAILRRKEFSKRTAAGPLALGLLIIYALTCIAAASMLINILILISGLGALLIGLFKKPVLIIQAPDAVKKTN
jgi:cytoskeletal protein CcmA (bactofilin family)